jgi:hypothetical protein
MNMESQVSTEVAYRAHGVPLQIYQLTRKHHRDQQTAEDVRAYVEGQAAE